MKTIDKNATVISNVATGTVVIEPDSTFGSALQQYDSLVTPEFTLSRNRFFLGDRELTKEDLDLRLQPGDMVTVFSKDAFDNGIEGQCEGCSDLGIDCEDATAEQKQAEAAAHALVEGDAPVATQPLTRKAILASVEAGETDMEHDPLGIGAEAFIDGKYDLSKLSEEVRAVVAPWDIDGDGFIDSIEGLEGVVEEAESEDSPSQPVVEGQHEAEDDDEDDDGSEEDDEDEDDEAVSELIRELGGEQPEEPIVEGQHTATLERPQTKPEHADAFDEDNQSYEIAKLPAEDQELAKTMDANGDGFISVDEYMNFLIGQMSGGPAADSDLN